MKRKGYPVVVLAVLVLRFCTIGVIAGKDKSKDREKQAAPTMVKVSAKLPTLAPMAETNPFQEKGGMKISVAPVQYNLAEGNSISVVQVRQSFKEVLRFGPPQAANVFVERTYTPALDVKPDRLIFKVHLSNQMPRVFRGSGIAVQFNVAGKLVAVNAEAYADIVNAIIPPRGEQELEVYGPQIATIPDPTTIGLFFYDVVTNTDNAGNVTEKQNFEWYFQYGCQLVEKELPVQPPERLFIRR